MTTAPIIQLRVDEPWSLRKRTFRDCCAEYSTDNDENPVRNCSIVQNYIQQ